jgi:glycosyltransferase 2 family protein
MTKKRILEIAKWVWIALVFIAAGYYLISHWQNVAGYFQTIPLINLVAGAIALAGAKIILVALSKFALDSEAEGAGMPFRQVFQIVAVTQLGKYIPGGIWHFVGRINAYTNQNASIKKSTWILVKETYWLLSGALLFGALAGIHSGPNGGLLTRVGIQLNPTWLVVTTLVLVCAWPISIIVFDRLFSRKRKPLSSGKIIQLIIIQVAAWALLGISFVMTNPVIQANTILLQMSVYSFSWALGYVVIFAPGGIGIREGAITFLLAGTMGTDNILIYSTVHRFLYVIIEVLLGVVAGLLRDNPVENP